VLVRKSTWDQTSVQWSAKASGQCVERREAEKLAGHGRRLFLACSALGGSIATAVCEGALPIVDEAVRAAF